MVVVAVRPAEARGLYIETPSWYTPAYVDTQITLTIGVSYLRARADATRFSLGVAAFRRGPIEFGGSLAYIFLRSPDGAETGLGDPRIDARVRLPLPLHPF